MLKATYEAVTPSSAASFSIRTFAEEAFSASTITIRIEVVGYKRTRV